MTTPTTAPARAARLFNGTYTISSPPSGEHRTFRIRTEEWKGRDPSRPPVEHRVLALLTGPNNRDDFESFAFVGEGGIRVWPRFTGAYRRPDRNGSLLDGGDAIPFPRDGTDHQKYAWMLWDLAANDGARLATFAPGYDLLVEGRCLRCNRKLTTPESILSGIGPVCAGREA